MTDARANYWDEQAETFDHQPDHGLRDPDVRSAWAELLLPLLRAASRVVDLGTGTGGLAVLLAQAGHHVIGADIAPRMIGVARRKAAAANVPVGFVVGDAAAPPIRPGAADAVVVRHLLWTLDPPGAAIGRWLDLLRPDGRLVMVEGLWSTGAGLDAATTVRLVREHHAETTLVPLTDPRLWGGPISDERYLLVARRR
ncbi:class I SAM-dependent methyltransferase [Pseudonocardia sp. TRM90224]|uniref:class I SAM-dependent methyltransferase n=1 Tax=Pseudonocardia sp. TRM90224 TaxID=2812678 RepID=UPI001E34CC9E|nr:class I SAM-dependent methyltransferase [Pseudonocardia sp. TRM90224]